MVKSENTVLKMVESENTTLDSLDVPPGFEPRPPKNPTAAAVKPTPDDSLPEQGCRLHTLRKRNQTEVYQHSTRQRTAAHPPAEVKPEAPSRRRGKQPKTLAVSTFSPQEEQRIESSITGHNMSGETSDLTVNLSKKIQVQDIEEAAGNFSLVIRNKHGDIAKDCLLESCYMKNLALIGISKVVEDLQNKRLEDLDVISLDFFYAVVRDAEGMKMNVEWLRKRLDEIKGAITLSDEANELKNERSVRILSIDGKKNELVQRKEDLKKLKAEVRGMEERMDQEKLTVEGLDNKYDDCMSRIAQFQRNNLMDGLI